MTCFVVRLAVPLLLLASRGTAQAQPWAQRLESPARSGVVASAEALDGGAYLVGWTTAWLPYWESPWIVRLSADRTIAWQFLLDERDRFTGVATCADGGVVCSTRSRFIRIAEDGTIRWTIAPGGVWGAIAPLPTGGFLAVGSKETGVTNPDGSSNRDAWIGRLDEAGAVVTQAAWADGSWETTFESIALSPTGAWIAGYTRSELGGPFGTYAPILVEMGPDLRPVRSWRGRGGNRGGWSGGVRSSGDGGVIWTGGFKSTGPVEETFVRRVDADGSSPWCHRFPRTSSTSPRVVSVGATSDGGAILVVKGSPETLLTRIDPAGSPEWSRTVEEGSVTVLADGELLFASSYLDSAQTPIVARLDATGGAGGASCFDAPPAATGAWWSEVSDLSLAPALRSGYANRPSAYIDSVATPTSATTPPRCLAPREPSALDLDPLAPPLRVVKGAAGELAIEWEAVDTTAYAVYRGTLESLMVGGYDHSYIDASACDVATNDAVVADDAGNHYYLVAAVDGGLSSSLGRDSFGVERSPPLTSCP